MVASVDHAAAKPQAGWVEARSRLGSIAPRDRAPMRPFPHPGFDGAPPKRGTRRLLLLLLRAAVGVALLWPGCSVLLVDLPADPEGARGDRLGEDRQRTRARRRHRRQQDRDDRVAAIPGRHPRPLLRLRGLRRLGPAARPRTRRTLLPRAGVSRGARTRRARDPTRRRQPCSRRDRRRRGHADAQPRDLARGRPRRAACARGGRRPLGRGPRPPERRSLRRGTRTEKAQTAVLRALTDRGYAYAKAQWSATVDLPGHAIDYAFTLTPGPSAVFGPITIVGLDPGRRQARDPRGRFRRRPCSAR